MRGNEDYHKGIGLLDDRIFKSSKELEDYRSKPNANSYIIKKRENEINELIDLYESLNALSLYSVWLLIESFIDSMEQRDKNLSGFHIIIRRRWDGDNFGLIDLTENI